MNRCIKCKKRIWWWQVKGFNSSWHKSCTETWEDGYNTAIRFSEKENRLVGYKTATELYREKMNDPFCI